MVDQIQITKQFGFDVNDYGKINFSGIIAKLAIQILSAILPTQLIHIVLHWYMHVQYSE